MASSLRFSDKLCVGDYIDTEVLLALRDHDIGENLNTKINGNAVECNEDVAVFLSIEAEGGVLGSGRSYSRT